MRYLERTRDAEAAARTYHKAWREALPLPEIADAVVREYAPVLGETLAAYDAAVAEKYGPEYERVHRRAITSIHLCISRWQEEREALGLPITAASPEIEAAYSARRSARGGWAFPTPRLG